MDLRADDLRVTGRFHGKISVEWKTTAVLLGTADIL